MQSRLSSASSSFKCINYEKGLINSREEICQDDVGKIYLKKLTELNIYSPLMVTLSNSVLEFGINRRSTEKKQSLDKDVILQFLVKITNTS